MISGLMQIETRLIMDMPAFWKENPIKGPSRRVREAFKMVPEVAVDGLS